ncbi:hypothetical protein A3A55_02355 [Candidatus Roizmanbacteria bacterium RIFCSPLOWO2_01_FULL_40_14]|nr:MAG: hypothetical protein A3A55_02355 [Candidatus Roizmanbacteria bacterium RIFCSPLOWO2_01_FULL_40_14]
MKHILSMLLVASVFLSQIRPVNAIVDPLSTPNNKFGVHIVDENDLDDAAKLVNSSGGEWGYVTIVIREDERDAGRWQKVFDRMRELKLIPVVRLATRGTADGWEVPTEQDAEEWAHFLNKLNWVVKNRYIILFNEPNHAHEWEGTIDPAGYTKIARHFRNTLKQTSEDFFILPAGFDQAAGNTDDSLSVEIYYRMMYESDPDIFTLFDGWTSHSYPNPHFSGSITASGRQSIQGYVWELQYLAAYGLPQNIPVFITETGWAHREGTTENTSYKPAEEVAQLFQIAYTDVWDDPQIVMVSPFLLNYQAEPFDNFSWKKPGSTEFYPQFSKVISLGKQSGLPIQVDVASVQMVHVITSLVTDSQFFVPIRVHNTGQTIWHSADTSLIVYDEAHKPIGTLPIPTLKPFQTAIIKLPITTPSQAGSVLFSVAVQRNNTTVGDPVSFTISVHEPDHSENTIVNFIREIVLKEIVEVVRAAN